MFRYHHCLVIAELVSCLSMAVNRSNDVILATGNDRQTSPTAAYNNSANMHISSLSDSSTVYSEMFNSSTATRFQEDLSLTNRSSNMNSGLILSVVQWIIFAIGTIGNFLVLGVLAWQRSPKQRVTQLFVASLSVADLGMMLGGAWVQAIVYIDNNDWIFGRPFCKLQFSLQIFMINCSIWTLAVLAMDRLVELATLLPVQVIQNSLDSRELN